MTQVGKNQINFHFTQRMKHISLCLLLAVLSQSRYDNTLLLLMCRYNFKYQFEPKSNDNYKTERYTGLVTRSLALIHNLSPRFGRQSFGRIPDRTWYQLFFVLNKS